MKFEIDYDYNFQRYCDAQSCCACCPFGENKTFNEVMLQDCKDLYLEKYFNKCNNVEVTG